MYNLIVNSVEGVEGEVGASRLYWNQDLSLLETLPTMVVPELGWDRPEVAQFGLVRDLRRVGSVYRFRFVPNSIPSVPMATLLNHAPALDIKRSGFGDFGHTAWSVKSPDLYEVLLSLQLRPRFTPKVFTLPDAPTEPRLMAVMMPFSADFAPTWKAINKVAKDEGWVCKRVLDVRRNATIVANIVDLIARAEVVVCDLSGHNPNVLYETGLAHALGRDVIPISQAQSVGAPLPFDLAAYRTEIYHPTTDGRRRLRQALTARLNAL